MILRDMGEDEAFYRIITPRYAHTPTSGAGAATKGGRFNRPGQEALYLSRAAETALLEFRQEQRLLPPGTITTFLVSHLRVVDFSEGYVADVWDPVWAEFTCNWRKIAIEDHGEPPTWLLADLVHDAGSAGLLFPSAAQPGGINLVIYDSSNIAAENLHVHDPLRDLPRNQSSWQDPPPG